ncbi:MULTISPECIES: hemolysin XhlA family protein [unclassified Clostridium]|uniref:hemolysin XhlA family protein n=1 Tax=unclassified Clostridium TaxID=2614128 RepID=UPI0002978BE3|nr:MULTISPECIES: hemolysin XhlA family protein [unclassified Clostridium]EKQ57206.1 MAG: Hemolysin XhlA [Clostridium sp. Maddingley MBC34-26]
MNESDSIQEIKERLVKIETLLENMSKTDELERKVIEEKIKVANNRITDLEDANKWLWRTVLGSFLTGAIAILVSLIKINK